MSHRVSPTRSRARRRAMTTTLAMAVSGLLLTGCLAPSGASNSGATGSGSAPGSAPGSATPSGDRIRLAMLQPPRSALSPFSDDAFKLSRWSTAETLVALDPASDPQPALATAWTKVDDRTWRFTIRPGVTFHDGTPLTADTVVTALTAATTATPKPRILDGVELTVTADGADAVLVATAQADPLLPHRLSSPQLSILAPSAYATGGPVSPIGTGTGPFELVAVNGTSTATLNRYDGYWGGPATAAGIDVSFVPDGTARAAALRTGTADVVEAVPVAQAALIEPELLHEVPMPRTNTLYLNTDRGVFADPAQRAAVRDAIDRAVLVDQVYEGRADVAAGLLGPAIPWSADRPARTSTPAGPAAGTITLATFSDRAELPEVAVLLAQQLQAAGYQVEQVVREYSYIETDALNGTFDAFILSRATVLDSGDPAAYLFSDFSCDGSFNISQLCDERVDAAIEQAAGTEAGPERRAALLAAERAVLETDAAIPLLHERVMQGELTGVHDAARDPRERTLITTRTGLGQ